jgi:DNA-binding HxlR family transcriptional regulator
MSKVGTKGIPMALDHSTGQTQSIAGRRLPDDRPDSPAECPASRAIELVAHKWTIHILFALHEAGGPVRFRKLQRAVEPITQKELTKRLRDLERAGMVDRRVYAEVPPRVEYRLTELGSSLIPALVGLHKWAEQFGSAVAENRSRGKGNTSCPLLP